MVLLRDEYEKEKTAFLDRYYEEIKGMLNREKEDYLKVKMQYVTVSEFLRNYSGVSAIFLIILYFAWAKEVISFDIFSTFAIMLVIVHIGVFNGWKRDMKIAALHAFSIKTQSLVSDFIYEKMVNDVSNSVIGVDFEKKVQFYSIALYEIPREFHFDVYGNP